MRTSVDIQQLVQEARSGDREAFGKLYDTYIDAIYRFVYFRVGSREDAEDITEQTFVSIFEHIGAYKEQGLPFEAWLFRIARNKLIDYYRKRKQNVSLDEIVEMEDKQDGPEEQTEQILTNEEVMRKLQKLPESYQEIIILKYIEEKDNEEISMLLDKPIAHIRVLQSRALQKLRSMISL